MQRNRSKPGNQRPFWKSSLLRGACLLLSVLTVRVVALQAYTITSGSMEPTLQVGDFVFVNKAALGARIPFTDLRIPGYSEPGRGEILVFDPPHEETLILVKRLIGMLGDSRDDSLDSRTWGLLERWRFEGRVVFRHFSYNRDSYRPFPFIREIRWNRMGTRPK